MADHPHEATAELNRVGHVGADKKDVAGMPFHLVPINVAAALISPVGLKAVFGVFDLKFRLFFAAAKRKRASVQEAPMDRIDPVIERQ